MGLEPTSGSRAATCFQDRPLIRPVGFREDLSFECGIGELNPGRLVGSQESCHWTNPAV